MNTTNTLRMALLVMASTTTALGAKKKQPVVQQPQDPNEMVAYLFTYFNSN